MAQAGSLGYWIGEPYARTGYMTAAVRALIPFAFGTLRLHRLEAACIPTNTASIRLLEKTGFPREGYAREYLCINGIWQDHLLYARLKDFEGLAERRMSLAVSPRTLAVASACGRLLWRLAALTTRHCRLGMATVPLI